MKKLIFVMVALLTVGLTAHAQDANTSVKKCPFSGKTVSTTTQSEVAAASKTCPHAAKQQEATDLKVLKANLPASEAGKTACQKKCTAKGKKAQCSYNQKQAQGAKLVKVAEDVPFINAVVKEEN